MRAIVVTNKKEISFSRQCTRPAYDQQQDERDNDVAINVRKYY